MLFAVDIGNTNIVMAVIDGRKVLHQWRVVTKPYRTKDEYMALIINFFRQDNVEMNTVTESIISSVVPDLSETFNSVTLNLFKKASQNVGSGMKTGLIIRTDNPREVGSDLIATAVAASELYPGNTIVLDCGTATKLTYITANKEFMGGAIAPGLEVSSKALSTQTASLPQVALEFPKQAIGNGTVPAIASGLMIGYVGLIKELIMRFKREVSPENPQVIGTGGLVHKFKGELPEVDVFDDTLLLVGLAILHEKNTIK